MNLQGLYEVANITFDSRIIYFSLPKGDYFIKVGFILNGTEGAYAKLFFKLLENSRTIIKRIIN